MIDFLVEQQLGIIIQLYFTRKIREAKKKLPKDNLVLQDSAFAHKNPPYSPDLAPSGYDVCLQPKKCEAW